MGLATGSPVLETTITDEVLSELVARHPLDLHVQQLRAREAETGADWEWWVLAGGRALPMRVQAKRLSDHATYPDVGRVVGKKPGAQRQLDVLIGDAGRSRLIPLYCFYNWRLRSQSAPGWGPHCTPVGDEDINGCTLALATVVRSALGAARDLPLAMIAGHSSPWSDLVCCEQSAIDSALRTLNLLGVEEPEQYIVAELPDYVRATLQGQPDLAALRERRLAGVFVIAPGSDRPE